jgi:hypothetical protein
MSTDYYLWADVTNYMRYYEKMFTKYVVGDISKGVHFMCSQGEHPTAVREIGG